ncbi:FxSxx-COOH cyclophane-containing RiPP peptide [Actinomadura napierensis]|uniref:FXSXX-COOH protein n=1 Tax=Actinomadura napierensis TaxID=267854 RepID=A0ABP5K8I0_9ACTN
MEGPSADLDGDLIDISELSLADLEQMDSPVLAAEVRRILDVLGSDRCPYARFDAVV